MAKKQYKKLDHETMKEICDLVLSRYGEEERHSAKARYDKRLRNTKMLLRNYRELVAHSESAIYDAAQIVEDDLFDILEMMSGGRNSSYYVESIKASAARTRIIIEHVNEMLSIYEIFCERSQRPEDRRRFRTIRSLYIQEEGKTAEAIARRENVDTRTVYRDVDAACEKLTALIFGIDGLPKQRQAKH